MRKVKLALVPIVVAAVEWLGTAAAYGYWRLK